MLQHGIPAHIAESARCLFRECMRRAEFLGNQHGNKVVLKSLVREQFRRNMFETDPQKIEEQKQAAARALFNHMYYEASRMAAQQGEDALIKESLLGLPKPALGMTLQDEDNKSSSEVGRPRVYLCRGGTRLYLPLSWRSGTNLSWHQIQLPSTRDYFNCALEDPVY